MQDFLRLQIYLDDDGIAELFADVQSNGFSGHGSAWIDPKQLAEMASKLGQAFPLVETLSIKGGYLSGPHPATLTQEHLAISFYPAEGRGVVGCQVRVATPLGGGVRAHSQHMAQVELLTSYQELQTFAHALAKLSAGESQEALLCAVEV